MGKTDPTILLSWDNAFTWTNGLLILIALIAMYIVMKKPLWFWPMLVMANIIGNGPKTSGYQLLDELLTDFIILGAVARLLARRRTVRLKTDWHGLIFLVWLAYMIVESVVGIRVNHDLRIIRWLLFYVMLGLLWWVTIHRHEFPFPSIRQFSLAIVSAAMITYLAYLAQGAYFESQLGFWGRFMSQDFFWAGSATAVFPFLVTIPATIFIIRDHSVFVRFLAWIMMAIIATVALYFDSRVSYYVISALLFFSWRQLKIRNMALCLSIFVIVFLWFTKDRDTKEDTTAFFHQYLSSTQALWSPDDTDLVRNLHLRASFLTVSRNSKTLLVGDGVYTHRFTIVPYLQDLYRTYITKDYRNTSPVGIRNDNASDVEIIRTTAFTGLLIDTGIIGMTLLILNFILAAVKMLVLKSSVRMTFFIIPCLAFMWLSINNISEVVLLYMLIMPCGLLEQWHQKVIEERREIGTATIFSTEKIVAVPI